MNSSLEWVSKQRALKFWSIELPPFGDDTGLLSRRICLRILKNRYFRTTMIFINIILGTAIIYSWQPFSGMLYATNVYSWNCSSMEIRQHEDAIRQNSENKYMDICSRQKNSIQLLYNLYTGSEFLAGALAGLCFDYIGPFLTCCIGQLLLFFGIFLLAVSSQSFQVFIPAIILIGVSANFIIIPALAISDYFPKWEGLLISMVIAFQNGGSLVTTCLDQVYRNSNISFKALFLGYLGFFLVPSGLLALLSTPLIRILSYRDTKDSEKIKKNQGRDSHLEKRRGLSNSAVVAGVPNIPGDEHDNDEMNEIDFLAPDYECHKQKKVSSGLSPAGSKGKSPKTSFEQTTRGGGTVPLPGTSPIDVKLKSPHNTNVFDTSTSPPSSYRENISLLPKGLSKKSSAKDKNINSIPVLEHDHSSFLSERQEGGDPQRQPVSFFSELARTYSIASSTYNSKFLDVDFGSSPASEASVRYSGNNTKICSTLMSVKFLLFVPIVILSTLQYNYYPVILRAVSGPDVALFNGFIFPTQALWGILYGVVVVYTRTLPIIYWLMLLSGLFYGLILTSVVPFHYIATILFVIGTTYVYSIKFTFTAEEFHSRHNGTLVGALSIASGLTLALNYLLVSLEHTNEVIIALEVSVALTIILTIILHIWTRRQRKI